MWMVILSNAQTSPPSPLGVHVCAAIDCVEDMRHSFKSSDELTLFKQSSQDFHTFPFLNKRNKKTLEIQGNK